MQTSRSWHEIRKKLQLPGTQTPQAASQAETASPHEVPAAQDWRFADAMGQVKRILLFVAFFSFVINLLMLVGPIYMMQVYDRVLTSGSVPTLVFLTIAAGMLILVGALLEGTRSRILVRLGGRIDEMMSARLFARLVEPDGGAGRERGLRDLDTVRNFLTGSGLFFFFDAPWTPLFLVVIFLLHPLLFAVALVGALILFALAVASELATRKPLTTAALHMAAASQFASNVSANADTVGAMGMLSGLRRRWQEQYRRGLLLQSRASDRAGLLTAITKFVRPICRSPSSASAATWR